MVEEDLTSTNSQLENHTQEKGDVGRKLSFKLSMVNAIMARMGSTMKGRQAMEDLAKVSAFITRGSMACVLVVHI